MSPIARKFFTTALIYLILGLLAQAVTAFDLWLGFNPLAYTAVAATQQLLLLGWLTQLGLALLYGRLETACPGGIGDSGSTQNPKSKIPKGRDVQNLKSSLVFILFNLGLPLVIIGQPGLALFGGNWLGAAAAVGGLLQFSAGLLLAQQVWSALKKS